MLPIDFGGVLVLSQLRTRMCASWNNWVSKMETLMCKYLPSFRGTPLYSSSTGTLDCQCLLFRLFTQQKFESQGDITRTLSRAWHEKLILTEGLGREESNDRVQPTVETWIDFDVNNLENLEGMSPLITCFVVPMLRYLCTNPHGEYITSSCGLGRCCSLALG